MSLLARALLLAITSMCLASCRSSVTTKTRVVAPGGDYAATITVKDCGAGCSPSATVTLHDLHDRIGKGDIEVFKGIGGWPAEVHWTGPKAMVVTFCDAKRFEARSRIFEGNVPDDEPWSPAITVIVVTDEEMVLAGKAYCRFPEPPTASPSHFP